MDWSSDHGANREFSQMFMWLTGVDQRLGPVGTVLRRKLAGVESRRPGFVLNIYVISGVRPGT